MTYPAYTNQAMQVLQELMDWFGSITEWIPDAAAKAQELVIGKIPDDDYEAVYLFADDWGEFARQFSDYLEDAGEHGNIISANWSGDAAAPQFSSMKVKRTLAGPLIVCVREEFDATLPCWSGVSCRPTASPLPVKPKLP